MATFQQLLASYPRASDYPRPVAVPPKQQPHKQSFIILHGRGDTGDNFGSMLLEKPFPDKVSTLADAFPHARFVFPTAAPRRATVAAGLPVSQWFDQYEINQQEERQGLQIEGLRETSAWIHIWMQREVEEVGAKNVVLGGLSQGAAMSLIANLLWEGPKIAGVVDMCGWLPLRLIMADRALIREQLIELEATDIDPGAREIVKSSASDAEDNTAQHRAVAALREYLDLTPAKEGPLPFGKTPAFIGHGYFDFTVFVKLGRRSADFLSTLGVDVTYQEYATLGHWYSPEMLKDVVTFVHEKTDWDDASRA
ncbi:MAG: hypothetical protein Q9162_005731 [Coniocarpon cinnabarinum]